jgi:hypothetical protein
MKQVHYEKHPVSAERKAELLALGFKIVDARFKPDEIEDQSQEEKPKRRTKRTAKQE